MRTLFSSVFGIVIFVSVLALLFLSQRFWFVRAWRLFGRIKQPALRRLLRAACVAAVALLLVVVVGGIFGSRGSLSLHRFSGNSLREARALAGLWLSSSLLAYLAVRFVAAIEWLWLRLGRWRAARQASASTAEAVDPLADPPDPSRRYFFQAASYLAGAVPFVAAVYGFAANRLRYQVWRVEVPIPHLPVELDGLRIAQLSDIHIGIYMPREQVRRAVEMANELAADLVVVTGDFITGAYDPLEACIVELARLRAPLGVWGCNGNHEIYADAEDATQELFHRHGMRLLRLENAELRWRGQAFNLIGVDYQRTRTRTAQRLPMLRNVEPLVRRDVPNILLSHNPNAFRRAGELGIELTLAGHTHGGQVQVEILDHRWNPARFLTPYIAGLYRRPLGAPASDIVAGAAPAANESELPTIPDWSLATASIYVNRGLGTIGAPVRLGVPPEITLLTLRRG